MTETIRQHNTSWLRPETLTQIRALGYRLRFWSLQRPLAAAGILLAVGAGLLLAFPKII